MFIKPLFNFAFKMETEQVLKVEIVIFLVPTLLLKIIQCNISSMVALYEYSSDFIPEWC